MLINSSPPSFLGFLMRPGVDAARVTLSSSPTNQPFSLWASFVRI